HPRGEKGGAKGAAAGGVVAVGAGAVAMENRDLLGLEPERTGEPVAQHRRALAVRPHLERAVLELGERAGRTDRAIGEERPREARLDPGAVARAAGPARLDRARARGLRPEPVWRADVIGRRRAAVPARVVACGLGCAHHRGLARRGESDEIALSQYLDRRLRGLAHSGFVERDAARAAPWSP